MRTVAIGSSALATLMIRGALAAPCVHPFGASSAPPPVAQVPVTPTPAGGAAETISSDRTDRDPRGWAFGVGTAVGVNSAAGPGAPLDFGIDLLVFSRQAGYWAPELRVGGLERGTAKVTRPWGQAVFHGWAVRIGASPFRWPFRGPLALRPVVGVELGRLSARGEDTVGPRHTSMPWRAFGLALSAELQALDVLGIVGESGMVVPLRHDDFYFESPTGRDVAFQVPELGLQARIGLVVRFP